MSFIHDIFSNPENNIFIKTITRNIIETNIRVFKIYHTDFEDNNNSFKNSLLFLLRAYNILFETLKINYSPYNEMEYLEIINKVNCLSISDPKEPLLSIKQSFILERSVNLFFEKICKKYSFDKCSIKKSIETSLNRENYLKYKLIFLKKQLLWSKRAYKTGDILKVKFDNYYHYGIVSDLNKVIHYSSSDHRLNPFCSNHIVKEVKTNFFLRYLDASVMEANFNRAKAASNAKKYLGHKKYDIVFNNCEQLVMNCAFNKNYSSYLERLSNAVEKVIPKNNLNLFLFRIYNMIKKRSV